MKKVLCHGVFDLLHEGHVKHLEAAREFGDYLIVSITADAFVRKGLNRPHFSQDTRKRMLLALRIVDEVLINPAEHVANLIGILKPDFYVKGFDYEVEKSDLTGNLAKEKKALEAYGGQFRTTNCEVNSSSGLLNKFIIKYSEPQSAMLARIKNMGGMDIILSTLSKLEKLKIYVVGEVINDVYEFCVPVGLSSKGTSLSVLRKKKETHEGGTAAICRSVLQFSPYLSYESGWSSGSIEKKRYVEESTGRQLFECCSLPTPIWNPTVEDEISLSRQLPSINQHDILLICDFGHGLFTPSIIQILSEAKIFTALNVQTNSLNLGFNLFTKYKKYDYLTMDLREARLALHDQASSAENIFKKIESVVPASCSATSMTLGPLGSLFYHRAGKESVSCPAFATNIVDAIGAGDAFFTLTSLLCRVSTNPYLILFLGNVFAGLKTQIQGNKRSVTKLELIQACKSLLA